VSYATRWWRSHSVRMRLTIWYVAAMVVVLAVYAVLVFVFVRDSALDALDLRLRDDFFYFSALVDETAEGAIALPFLEVLPSQDPPSIQVWSDDGRELLLQNEIARVRPVPETQALARSMNEGVVSLRTPDASRRVLTQFGRIGERPVVFQVWRSEAPMRDQLREFALFLVFGLPVAVAAAGLGGYVLARRALEPVERMTERARTITAERLSDRLPVVNPDDEMGRLAEVFNETLQRLETSFDQMRRFTADVSHELRTPLTAIRSVGEVGLRGHRDDQAYRGIIGSMLEEADRLASLVDRLLTLSRAETGQATLSREPVDLRALVDDVIENIGVLAEEKQQTIAVSAGPAPQVLVDRLTMRQALINLLDNAIKFTPVKGRIDVRIAGRAADVVIDVVDSGPGIPPDVRARIFDRFYRAGSDVVGTGLGLSIAKTAVDANGGRLTVEASGAGGSTFRIILPTGRQSPGRT
jgi:heavy metal sensor kinase